MPGIKDVSGFFRVASAAPKSLRELSRDPVAFALKMIPEGSTHQEIRASWLNFSWAAWADCGFPVFKPSEALMASLQLSDIRVPLRQVKLPFRSFAISFDPPVRFDLAENPPIAAALVTEWQANELWVVLVSADGASSTNGSIEIRDEECVSEATVPRIAVEADGSAVLIGGSDRSELLSFIFGLSLYVSEVSHGERVYKHKTNTAAQRKKAFAPQPRVWVVGKDVKIRPELLEAARSGGTTRAAFEIHSRFVVRGHWRNQPHGPAHQLRRRQWIQPHWKGPETGPQLVRAYSVEV